MSYGNNENDGKVLSRFKLIVSPTWLWILQAYSPQLLHFKTFISSKSHEAFRPENVLLINRSYQEGSSVTLFMFSTVCCLLCMLYSALPDFRSCIPQIVSPWCPLSLGSVLPNPLLSTSPLSASPRHPLQSPLPLLSWDPASVWLKSFNVPAGLNTSAPLCSFLPLCCLSYSASTSLLCNQVRDWI